MSTLQDPLDFFAKKEAAMLQRRILAGKCCAYCPDFGTVTDKHGHYCHNAGNALGSDGLLYCAQHMAKRHKPTFGVFRSRAFAGGEHLWKDLPTRKRADYELDSAQRNSAANNTDETWWIATLPPKEPPEKKAP